MARNRLKQLSANREMMLLLAKEIAHITADLRTVLPAAESPPREGAIESSIRSSPERPALSVRAMRTQY